MLGIGERGRAHTKQKDQHGQMQPFKHFRFVHNNKEFNYPAIPEPDDFFQKEAWELLIYLILRPSTARPVI